MHVHIWAEDRPLPQAAEAMRKLYPQGVEGQIAAFLRKNEDMTVTTSTMAPRISVDMPYKNSSPGSNAMGICASASVNCRVVQGFVFSSACTRLYSALTCSTATSFPKSIGRGAQS